MATAVVFLSGCTGDRDVQDAAGEQISSSRNDSMVVPEVRNTETIVFRTDTIADVSLPGWGYDIYIDGKKMIHQPHIPAVPGRQVFSSEAEAEKVASLVSYKILNNIMPPSVTTSELDSLGIDYE
jgi:hypothetical protein